MNPSTTRCVRKSLCSDEACWRATDTSVLQARHAPDYVWPQHTHADVLDAFPEVGVRALQQVARLNEAEPIVTGTLQDLKDLNGQIIDLQYRLKAPYSMARKVAALQRVHALTVDTVLQWRLRDGLRYTLLCDDHDSLVPALHAVVQQLDTLTIEDRYPGRGYKGLHLTARSPADPTVTFEVQLHSKLTLDAKADTRHDYTIARDDRNTPAERQAASDRRDQVWATIRTPKGLDDVEQIDSITIHRDTPYEPRNERLTHA